MFYLAWFMRITLWISVISLAFHGCTTINVTNRLMKDRLNELRYTDSAFRVHVASFVEEANKRDAVFVDTNKLTMIFGTTRDKESPHAIGECSMTHTGYPLVIIDKEYWDGSDFETKEQLVYHELGHCLLGRDHCEAPDNELPYSIMEPNMFSSQYYYDNRDMLVNELFNTDSRCSKVSCLVRQLHLYD